MQQRLPTLPADPGALHARRQSARSRVREFDRAYEIACWWAIVLAACVAITAFGDYFLPDRFRNDVWLLHDLMSQENLWEGLSYDGYLNTARVWAIVLLFLPEELALIAFAVLLVVGGARLLNVRALQSPAAHAMAGAWFVCAAVFLAQPSKEMIALPVALFLCMARRPALRWTAALVFIGYTVYFRQYWGITFFYFLALLLAFRLYASGRPLLGLLVVAAALVVPFFGADLFSQGPLTDARNTVNEVRVTDVDSRSVFSNPLVNTGPATDLANAVLAWFYLNVPLLLASQGVVHYLFFAIFQIATLVFFTRGCRRCLNDLRSQPGASDTQRAARCAALVIAYSMTLCIFEPDFGSFLRHQIVVMLPMLVVGCYRR